MHVQVPIRVIEPERPCSLLERDLHLQNYSLCPGLE